MSQTLKLNNFSEINIVDQTLVTADTPAGSSSLTVQNARDFTSLWLLFGDKGSKDSELLANTSVTSGTSIPLTGVTVLLHPQYTPVYSLYGNQLNIYRAANVDDSQPDDTQFTLLATVTIDPNGSQTTYLDASGGGNYWYKYTFYNSSNSNETSIGDAVGVRGSFTPNYCSLDDIRDEAGFSRASYITDGMIDLKRRAAQSEIDGTLTGFYNVPFQSPINPWIADICRRLAAGLLLLEQYGAVNTLNTADGEQKVKDARSDLQALAMKEKELTDQEGNSLALAGSTGGISSWPNATTADADPSVGGAPRLFRMSDIKGYYGSRKW